MWIGPVVQTPIAVRRSTSSYCMFLGHNLISLCSKRQHTVSCCSAGTEYKDVANAMAETCWIRLLLGELRHPLTRATVVYCDNIYSAVYLFTNSSNQRTKHVEIDLHFVSKCVALWAVCVLHVPMSLQYTDIHEGLAICCSRHLPLQSQRSHLSRLRV